MISLAHARTKMTTAREPFVLRFVRSSGKKRGSIKTVEKATAGYGAYKFAKGNHNSVASTQRKRMNHKYAGTMPITDYETGDLLTPLVSHLLSINGEMIKH